MKAEIKEFMDALKARTVGESEFHQAVQEVIETVWDTYLNGVQASEGKMSKAYEYEVDGKVYSISRSYRTFVYSYEEEGKVVTESYPYIQTLEGVKMYSSMNLGGIEVHDLIFDGDTKSLKSRDGKVVLTKAVTPPAQPGDISFSPK